MRITLESSDKIFKLIELFKVIKSLSNICTLYCKESGVFIQTMDDAHVSLLDITINKDWFCEFSGDDDENITVNVKILSTVLALYSQSAKVSFTSFEDYLVIDLKYEDKTEKSFEIPRMDLDHDVMSSQKVDHSLEFSINTKKMDRYICDMQIFGDTMELIYIDEIIFMRASGDEGKYCLKLTTDLVDDLIVEDDLRLMGKVPLKYPSIIGKMYPVFEQIYISISENSPFTFRMSDVGMDIIYYVAPKVEDDDEFDYTEFEKDYVNQIIE